MKRSHNPPLLALAIFLALAVLAPRQALAHCDGLDGPVAKAAQQALSSGSVNPALAWIQAKDEPEVRAAFAKTLAVRTLTPEARELADRHFLETVVRLHRSGEGAPYTGLQPAGRDLGPVVPAADKAVDSGSVDSLSRMIADAAAGGIKERFQQVAARKAFAKDDVAAAREYVKAYVGFMHYIERLHEAVHSGSSEHSHDAHSGETHVSHQ